METISYIWPLLGGSVIVPLVAYIKKKWLPKDFPLRAPLLTALANLLVIVLLFWVFKVPMNVEQIFNMALAGQVTSQFVHAGKKTANKLPVNKPK